MATGVCAEEVINVWQMLLLLLLLLLLSSSSPYIHSRYRTERPVGCIRRTWSETSFDVLVTSCPIDIQIWGAQPGWFRQCPCSATDRTDYRRKLLSIWCAIVSGGSRLSGHWPSKLLLLLSIIVGSLWSINEYRLFVMHTLNSPSLRGLTLCRALEISFRPGVWFSHHLIWYHIFLSFFVTVAGDVLCSF